MKALLKSTLRTTTNKNIANLLCENYQGFYTIDDMLREIVSLLITHGSCSKRTFERLPTLNTFEVLQQHSVEIAILAVKTEAESETLRFIGRYMLTRRLSESEQDFIMSTTRYTKHPLMIVLLNILHFAFEQRGRT